MGTNKKSLDPLLPVRHPQMSFFVCDILDAAPKSDTASMAHPMFSLSTRPDHKVRHYEYKDLVMEIRPSAIGMATVHDRDVLIYCISQCMAALNQGQKISRNLRFKAHDLLVVTNRETSGSGYKGLLNALERLQGTQVKTNISFGDGDTGDRVFSFIDEGRVTRKGRKGRAENVEIILSDWLFQAIREKGGDILTISRDYFRLRKPLERRLYELARKSCGTRNKKWSMTLQTLHHRSGSQSTFPEFKRMVKVIIDNQDHIPDYTFDLEDETVHFRPREELHAKLGLNVTDELDDAGPRLKTQTLENARKDAQGHDIYAIESDWRSMIEATGQKPDSPDGAFIGYVRWFVQKHGPASR